MTAALTNIFGDELEIIGRCSACGAPRTRIKGQKDGATLMHAKGCIRPPKMGDHHEARDWTEQSIERDYNEARDRGDFRV